MTTVSIDETTGIRIVHICDEEDKICSICKELTECRPYGPNFSQICFPCASKDLQRADKRMNHLLYGDPISKEDILLHNPE